MTSAISFSSTTAVLLLTFLVCCSASSACIPTDEAVNVVDGKALTVAYSTLTCCDIQGARPACRVVTIAGKVHGTCKCSVPFAKQVEAAQKESCAAAHGPGTSVDDLDLDESKWKNGKCQRPVCEDPTPAPTEVVGCISGAQREQGWSGSSESPTWKISGQVQWGDFTFREAMCRCQRGAVGHLRWHGAQHLDVIDEDPSKPNYMFMGLGGATSTYVHMACFNGHVGPQGEEGRKHHEDLVHKCWEDRDNYKEAMGNSCRKPELTPGTKDWKFPTPHYSPPNRQFSGYQVTDKGLPLEQCKNGGVEKRPDGTWQYIDNPEYPNANYSPEQVRGLLTNADGDIDIGAMRTDLDGTDFYAGGWERFAVYRVPAPSAYDCQGYCDTYQSHAESGSGVTAQHDMTLKGESFKAGEDLPYRKFGRNAHCTPGGVQDGTFPTGTATDFTSWTPLPN